MARIIDGKAMNMVGDRVKELRLKRKLSQQALLYGLAEVLGVSIESLFENADK